MNNNKKTKDLKQGIGSHVRKYILISLHHCETKERRLIESKLIGERLRKLFKCKAIIIGTEKDKLEEGAFHFHVAINNTTVSKNNYIAKIRDIFSEWDSLTLKVSNKKYWGFHT